MRGSMLRALAIFATLNQLCLNAPSLEAQALKRRVPAASLRSTSKTAIGAYAALAVDRTKGFVYGFAVDQKSRADAEARASQEVIERGGNPSIVLAWSGQGCGAYRTVPENSGTAYGWGLAVTLSKADSIALAHASRRSDGKVPSNHAWACNRSKASIQRLYEDPDFQRVKIGKQEWMRDNLSVVIFRNGDSIPRASDWNDLHDRGMKGLPAYWCRSPAYCARSGVYYNGFAVIDPRGLAPSGWRLPTAADFAQLISFAGGKSGAGLRLRKPGAWADWSIAIDNPTGFDAVPAGWSEEWWKPGRTPDDDRRSATFWSATAGKGGDLKTMNVSAYGSGDEADLGQINLVHAVSVRLIRSSN